VTLAATTTGYEVCPEKLRYEVKPVQWKGIYLPVLYTISTLKPLHDILLIFQQLLVQTKAHVLATVLFTQDYVNKERGGIGNHTIVRFKRKRSTRVKKKNFTGYCYCHVTFFLTPCYEMFGYIAITWHMMVTDGTSLSNNNKQTFY